MPNRKYSWDEITEEYKSGKRLTELKEKYGFRANRLLYVQLHKRGIVTQGNGGRLPARLFGSYQKLTADKAYILGVLCGDGFVGQQKGYLTSIQIKLQAVDTDFLDNFKRCMVSVYGIMPHVYTSTVADTVVFNSVLAGKDLFGYCDSFKTREWCVPEEIKRASEEIKMAFLRGLFDSEGYVTKGMRFTRKVGICIVNKSALKDISLLLRDIGIENCYIGLPDYDYARIEITGRDNLQKVYRYSLFSIERQQQKLKEMIDSYKYKPQTIEIGQKGVG